MSAQGRVGEGAARSATRGGAANKNGRRAAPGSAGGQAAPEQIAPQNVSWARLATGAPVVQTKELGDGGATPAETSILLTDDEGTPGPAQMRLSDFLAVVRSEVCRSLEEVLSAAGRTTASCPYVARLFPFLERQSAATVERILRRFAPGLVNPPSALSYVPFIVERAREATRAWLETGEIRGLPEGLPRSLEALAGLANGRMDLGSLALNLKAKTGKGKRALSPEAVQSRLGSGQPLDAPIRGWMESAFGTSFSDVRIHTDGNAAALSSELNAHAFTVGADVAFGAGEYRPGTIAGDALIAHELAHVVQQRGVVGAQTADPETAADQAALAVFEGREARPGSVGGLKLQRCGIEGSGFDPTETEEYHRAPPTPDEMIARHTTALGDLNEDRLGETLAEMAWYTPRHHDFIRRVFEALDSGDRDDVAAAMIARTRDSDLADIARTEEGRRLLAYIVPELTSGWTWPGGDTYAAVRALRALRAHEAANAAVPGELDDLRRAVGAASAPADMPVELLSRQQIEERLSLVEVHLERLREKFGRDSAVMAAVAAVSARIATARADLRTRAPDVSRSVQIAQQILETCEIMLEELSRQISVLENELQRRGTEEANIELLRFVRDRFVDALGAALEDDAALKFAQAGAALEQLSLSQAEIELAVLRRRPGLFSAVESKLDNLRSFAGWTISELNELEAEAVAVREEERAGKDTTARRTAARRRLEKIVLAHRVLANWEIVIQVAEALESGFSFTEGFYGHDVDVDSIHATLSSLAQYAQNDDLDRLRSELEGFENDRRIREYYDDVPSILKSSGIVVSVGVAIAAALVTWGVGTAFAAPAGAAAGGGAVGTSAAVGTVGTVTVGSIARAAGANLLNALVFTSVHRGLATATNVGVSGSYFEDLLWNFGLFSVLRTASFGVRAGLAARGLMHLAGRVQLGTAFGLLETYGVVRFWFEENRLPTATELAAMTAQTVVILAALFATHAAVERLSPLGRFQARWGSEFEAIRHERHVLEQDAHRALAEGRTEAFEKELRERGRALETRLRELIDQVIAEGNIGALRTQLGVVLEMEASQAALTEAMGLLPEVALRPAGTPNTFSYRHGETERLTEGLRGLNAGDVRVIDPESGGRARVVEVRFRDRPSLAFVERAAERAPESPPTETPQSPAEQNAVALEAAKEALTRRRISWSEVPEDLRSLQSASPRGQSRPQTIRRTAELLRRLEAWIASRPETPWQLGREVRIEMPSDTAQARVAALREGPLRSQLQGNPRAAIIFGALSEASPATAGSRMQGIFEAWLRTNQEQSFAEFADSALIEAGVAELEAASEGVLANLLRSDGGVQNAFGRMGYDVARLRAVHLYHQHGYRAALSFSDYVRHEVGSLQGEGRSWSERRGALSTSIPADGFEPLRTRLSALTSGGLLTDVDAGIVWRWSAAIETLINGSAARVPGAQAGTARATAVLDYLLEGLGKNFSESAYRTFRLRIRALMVDDIVFVRDGGDASGSPGTHDGTPVRPWADQSERLTLWEGRIPRGDPASIGALWTAYARARFELGLPSGSTAAGIQSVSGRNLRMPDGRMADDVLQFGRRTDPTAPRPGEWAADYKGGADPFDADQARNYSENMTANGGSFLMGGQSYRGLLLLFRSSEAATRAAESLNADGAHPNLKVGYFSSATGAIVWIR
jgi:hypothetical protein